MGVVRNGLVDLQKPDGQIQTLLPGQIFGEQMLLFKQASPYTVRSRSEASLWVITRSDWLQALQITSPAAHKRSGRRNKNFPFRFIGLLILLVCSTVFLYPELPQWANGLILKTLNNANRADLAQAYLELSLQYNPTSAALNEAMGVLSYQNGDKQSAGTLFEEAVRLDEYSASAWNNLGVVYLQGEEPEDSLGALLKAVELDPGNPEIYFNLGSDYLRADELQLAADAFRRAFELKPDYQDAKI